MKSLKKNKTKNNSKNVLLIGFPSNGLIGTFTTSYLINTLKMKQIGEIEHPNLPPTLYIENGDIYIPIRIYNKGCLYVIVSELPIEPKLAYEFGELILNFCKQHKIGKLMMVSGIDSPINNKQTKRVSGLVTHPDLEKILYENRIPKFLFGTIYGTDAAVISVFRKSKIPALILYAQCHPYIPDSKASIEAISTLFKVLNLKIDISDLKQKIDYLRIQYRTLMQDTVYALQQRPESKLASSAPQIYN